MTVTSSVHDGDPLTWEEYDALPEEPRAEYVDGFLVVTPPPTRTHQELCVDLRNLLKSALPADHGVTVAWEWRTEREAFSPDVMAYLLADVTDDRRLTRTPLLCVEVLSTNRRHDLVRKMTKYADAGLPHYWIVDPRDRTLTSYVLEDGTFRPTEVLHDTDPPKDLDLGVAHLRVDAATLFTD